MSKTSDVDAKHNAKMAKIKAARVLDEINIALRYDYMDINEVLDLLQNEKPPLTHVVRTGRNAKPELIEAANLVAEMTWVNHAFRDGIKAQAGIDF